MLSHIKKNDRVHVLTGKDKNKQGTVIEVLPKKGKVLIKDIALVTRHLKARKQGEVAEIKKQESYINISNVMLICTSCHKPARINAQFLENGKKVRICNRCKQIA